MKYNNEVIINRPIDEVVALFENPDNLAKWQPGFISMEHIAGEYGKPGAKYCLKYQMGKRQIDMIETILKRDLPEEFSATYEAKGVWNEIKNHFESLDNGKTRYWTENEFKFKGFMKIFALLMPGAFKKQSQKYLDMFRDFAENEKVKASV